MSRSKDKPSSSSRRQPLIGHPSRKRLGEAIEAAFLAVVALFNFDIARPWGETHPYDFLVSAGRGFWRVQVKATERCADNRYRVKATGWRDAYTSDDIDFIAAYIVPEKLWYIVPIESIAPRKGLRFYPHDGRKSLFEKYREAWCLLACDPKARGWKDIPAVCRCRKHPIRCSVCPRKNLPQRETLSRDDPARREQRALNSKVKERSSDSRQGS